MSNSGISSLTREDVCKIAQLVLCYASLDFVGGDVSQTAKDTLDTAKIVLRCWHPWPISSCKIQTGDNQVRLIVEKLSHNDGHSFYLVATASNKFKYLFDKLKLFLKHSC